MASSSNHDFKKESKAESATSTSSSSSQAALTAKDIFENVELQLSNLWKTNVKPGDFFRITGAIRRGTHQESFLTLMYIHEFFDQHADEPIASRLNTLIINLADAFNIAYKVNPSDTLNILQSFLKQNFDHTQSLSWWGIPTVNINPYATPLFLSTSTSEVHQQARMLLTDVPHLQERGGPLPKLPSDPFNIRLAVGNNEQTITADQSILIGEYWSSYSEPILRIFDTRFSRRLSPICLPPSQPPLEETPYAILPKKFKTFLNTYNIEKAKWTSDDKKTRQNLIGRFIELQQAFLTKSSSSTSTSSSSSSTSLGSSSFSRPSSLSVDWNSSVSMFHFSEIAEFQARVTQRMETTMKNGYTSENQALITFFSLLELKLKSSTPGNSKDEIIENLLSKYYQQNNLDIPYIVKALPGLLSYDQTRLDKVINKAKAQAQITRTKTEPPSGCVIS